VSEDFIKALWDAQELPDIPESVAKHIPDLLAGASGQQRLVRKVGIDEAGKIPGAKDFNFEFQCARLVIGNEVVDRQNGKEITAERDDTARLKEIMDKTMRGEAIISKRETTILKDGTVVAWVEWMEPTKALSKTERGFMTIDELLDPEPSKSKSEDSDEDDSESGDSDYADDAGASPFRTSDQPNDDEAE